MVEREIRADFDQHTTVVYQAYRKEIAVPAVEHNHIMPPFSLNRMTWIKPSFLWMMERGNWGLKPGKEHILAVRITRQGWKDALTHAVLTSFEPRVYGSFDNLTTGNRNSNRHWSMRSGTPNGRYVDRVSPSAQSRWD
jgi:hypothetical protein